MTTRQLQTWLRTQLKKAEPLGRPSTMEDAQPVAVKAVVEISLLGYGSQGERVSLGRGCFGR